jgi:hypothetical protein
MTTFCARKKKKKKKKADEEKQRQMEKKTDDLPPGIKMPNGSGAVVVSK